MKKKNWKHLALVLILGLCVSAFTCSQTQTVTVCQEVPGPSLLEQYIPDMKLADTMFKLSVLEVGRLDQVRQKDVAKVLDETEALLTAGTTYDGLVMYLLPKFKQIQKFGGQEIVIVGEYFTSFEGIRTPIEPRDVCYLKSHLDSQRKKVLPWIKRGI